MGAISRSLPLAVLVMVITVVVSFAAGMAFRARFPGSNWLFYLVVASLVAPGYVLSIGIGLMFQLLGWNTDWYTSALGAQLSWTLPFGLLIMFAVFGRYDRAYEEAARDLGAFPMQTLRLVVVPMLLPGVIAVALFGFTLSYDEFARTLQTVGSSNTVPIEIWSMTQNVTTPSIYALGTLTTALSFVVIGVSLGTIAVIQRRRLGVTSPYEGTGHGYCGRNHVVACRERHRAGRRDRAGRHRQALSQRGAGGERRQPADRRRQLLLPAGAERVRQDDHAAHDRRPRGADRR